MLSCHTQYLESRMNLFHEAKKVLDKDGKVNPLGPYGKMKLTGREVSTYFRRNKVSDPEVKKAVEVALDMSGAMDIAAKEIKKFFGDKILKSKEVQSALKYANEGTISEGEMVSEDYKKVIKMFPRDNDWKKLITKYKRDIDKFRNNNKDLPKKVEDELLGWASQTGEVSGKHDAEDFIMSILDESTISENYRVLAKHGMGAETKNSIKVGTEVDYYQADGAKYMGKVVKMGPKSYIVRDDKTKKNYQFFYHDRVKAKKYLKQGDNIGESYLNMFAEEVQDITVDPKNKKFSSPSDQNYHGMEIAKAARRFKLKAAVLGKHVRIKGNKKQVNDFLRVVIGKSSYGDPTNGDYTTPQIDKMLTKGMK